MVPHSRSPSRCHKASSPLFPAASLSFLCQRSHSSCTQSFQFWLPVRGLPPVPHSRACMIGRSCCQLKLWLILWLYPVSPGVETPLEKPTCLSPSIAIVFEVRLEETFLSCSVAPQWRESYSGREIVSWLPGQSLEGFIFQDTPLKSSHSVSSGEITTPRNRPATGRTSPRRSGFSALKGWSHFSQGR